MTENKKEQVLKKEISMEMAEEVVGGGKEFLVETNGVEVKQN